MAQVFINYDANVYRCCTVSSKIDTLETKDLFYYGNIKEDSFKEILKKMNLFEQIFQLLHKEGPGGIYFRVRNKLNRTGFFPRKFYYSNCELCFDLFGNKSRLEIIKNYFCK